MNRLATSVPPNVPLPAQAGGTYSYDWVGNMKAAASSNPWQYNAADQLTLWPGMHSYEYDDNGALTAVKMADGQTEQQTFSYHPTGLLNEATFNNQTQTLTNLWDADEHRVQFSIGEDEYTAVFDVTAGIPAVIKENTPQGTVYYVREPGGELICRVATVGETTHKWFYHFDELGSTRLITSDANPATVTDRYSYDAYGALLVHDRNASSIDQPYQYVGQLGYYTHYQAPELGWLQLGVRFYEPEVGRFERRDPEATTAYALQAYCGGQPLSWVDVSGGVAHPRRNPGPWHPKGDISCGCKATDSQQKLQAKIWCLERMIRSHLGWDEQHQSQRHRQEIGDLGRALTRCRRLWDLKERERLQECDQPAREVFWLYDLLIGWAPGWRGVRVPAPARPRRVPVPLPQPAR